MALPRSILLARPIVPATPPVRAVRAYGDLDDPVRLLVVLADHLQQLLPAQVEHATHCLDRTVTWRARLDALRELLSAARTLDRAYAALIDPDALAPAVQPGWEDRAAHRMREDIRDVLFDAVGAGGWFVAQLHRTQMVSAKLDQIDIDPEQPDTTTIEPPFAIFAPDVRPTARWLVDTKRLPLERIDQIVEDTRDPNEHVLRIAYDAMPEDARETARRLHVTRGPNAANGTLGPFHWSDDPHDGLEVKRTDVELLLRAGFLCHDNEAAPAELVMPRRVRELLSVHADALDAELVTGLHAQLSADTAFHQRTKEQQIEIHHHAARAGDLERVRSTALYYGFELRSLATRLSRDRKFEDAAALFRELVQEFDREDPYAWEYLGFNLALGDKQARKPGDRATEILAAYEMAHRLDRKNPLYHGRHLGYRAERGYPVGSEVRSAIQHYAERGDAGELVSWFLMPVMDGLFRAHRHAERDAILGEWHTLLEWCAPKVLEKHLPVEE